MNISSETLKLLDNIISNNPKHSPKGHWCDYYRWLDFICCSYRNNDYIESWDFYDYLVNNGYENFKQEAKILIEDYQTSLDLINHLFMVDKSIENENIKWLIDELKSK